MSNSDITVFAETNFRNQRRKFGIKVDDRRRHMYLVGKTGMGKSTTLENMIVNDIRAGKGLALVDPHGDLAEAILQFIPNNRVNDVIYFNPSDTKFPVAFNILESVGEDYKHLVAYGLVGVFKKIWADSWGPRMEYIMTNTILALLDYPGSTLLGVMRMLVDKAYRKKVVSKLTDPVVKTFWTDEFANYTEKFRTEAIAPIQNKVGQFLSSAIIRNIVGQSKSTIEMREIMDNQKILIMNLAKGRVGEENSALLGAMMITKLQIAAMSRVDIPEDDRKDFYLYVDEFQNFATDSFAGILSEARKYRLCLIMAHQYFEQLGDVVKAAVFGNVGTMIIFRVGATDAAELELEFAPQFLPADIVNLKKYCFCMRLMVDGVATEPFSGIGLPPVTGATDNSEKVIRVSRERYARPQNMVEDRIIRWSGVEVNRPDGEVIGAVGEERPDTVEFDDYDTANNVQTRNLDGTTPVVMAEPEPEENITTASTAVQLDAADAPNVNGIVNPDSFIPDAGLVEPELLTTITPPEAQPEVVHEITSLAEEEAVMEDTIEQPNIKHPKISFIDHTPSVFQPEADQPLAGAEAVAEPVEPVAYVDAVPEPAPVATDVMPLIVTASAEPTRVVMPVPDIVDFVETKPQTLNPKPSTPVPTTIPNMRTTPQAQPVTNQVSLGDLQRGTAPKVSFSGKPNQPQNNTQAGNQLEGIPGEGQRAKRRRRRRGGSGGGAQPQTLNPQPLSQPKPSTPASANMFPSPVVSAAPKPQAPAPQLKPQSLNPKPFAPQPKPASPAPIQSKPQPTSNQTPDKNKVSWGDILPS